MAQIRIVFLALLAATTVALAQDPPKPPEPKKQDPAPAPAATAPKIATEEEVTAAIAAFKKAYAADLVSAKVTAVKTLGDVHHEKVIKQLAQVLVGTPVDVAANAAVALGLQDHPSAAEALVNAINPNLKQPVVAAAILSSLGKLGYEMVVPTLNKLTEKNGDDDVMALMSSIIQCEGRIGSQLAVDSLIDLRRKTEGSGRGRRGGRGDEDLRKLRGPCDSALTSITGGQTDGKANEFEDWWKISKNDLVAASTVTWICKSTWVRVDAPYGKKAACTHAGEKGHESCMVAVVDRLVPAGQSPQGGGGNKAPGKEGQGK